MKGLNFGCRLVYPLEVAVVLSKITHGTLPSFNPSCDFVYDYSCGISKLLNMTLNSTLNIIATWIMINHGAPEGI